MQQLLLFPPLLEFLRVKAVGSFRPLPPQMHDPCLPAYRSLRWQKQGDGTTRGETTHARDPSHRPLIIAGIWCPLGLPCKVASAHVSPPSLLLFLLNPELFVKTSAYCTGMFSIQQSIREKKGPLNAFDVEWIRSQSPIRLLLIGSPGGMRQEHHHCYSAFND